MWERGASLLRAVATLPAVAFLVVVHWAVLTGLFAVGLVSRKSCGANHCDQNRKRDLGVILHRV